MRRARRVDHSLFIYFILTEEADFGGVDGDEEEDDEEEEEEGCPPFLFYHLFWHSEAVHEINTNCLLSL